MHKRRLTIIITVYITGILSALILTSTYAITVPSKDFEFIHFLKYFCRHFWYLFVIWIVGFSKIGKIFVYFVLYFKGLSIGVLIKNLITLNFRLFFAIFTIDLLLILPILIVLANASLNFSEIKNQSTFMTKKYENWLYIAFIITLIYSFLLEMVGGIYG